MQHGSLSRPLARLTQLFCYGKRYYAGVKPLVVALLLLSLGTSYTAGADADGAVKDVLETQANAWNRGDLQSFMSSYADDCTFMGTPVMHGRAQVLTRYRKAYPTSAAMGQLTFSALNVRLLDHRFATATGDWHLARDAAGGGDAGGYFSLVLENRNGRWRILLDHTSSVKAANPHP